jgi:hypothetical protein
MKGSRGLDVVAGILGVLALVAGAVQLFVWPFVFGLLATIAVVVAIVMSPKYRALYGLAIAVIGVAFVLGAAITVISDRSLY